MTENLKPCPFCGGEARVRIIVDQNFVECGKCWAHSAHALGCNMTKEEAIKAWNRRVEKEVKE